MGDVVHPPFEKIRRSTRKARREGALPHLERPVTEKKSPDFLTAERLVPPAPEKLTGFLGERSQDVVRRASFGSKPNTDKPVEHSSGAAAEVVTLPTILNRKVTPRSGGSD